MLVDYDGTEYDFDVENITLKQAKAIKDSCGLTLHGLEVGIEEGDPDALRAMFWLMQVSSGVKTSLEDVDFKIVKFSKAIDEAVRKQQAADAEEAEAEEAKVSAKVKKSSTVKAAPELV
jgi:hypothetical protein